MNELEMLLLKLWKNNGILEIYKYKGRIVAFREPLTNMELFNDVTMQLFSDVEDIANHKHSTPEEYKVNVEQLIQNRKVKSNS